MIEGGFTATELSQIVIDAQPFRWTDSVTQALYRSHDGFLLSNRANLGLAAGGLSSMAQNR